VIIHAPVHPPAWQAQYEGYPRNSRVNDEVFERRRFIGFKTLSHNALNKEDFHSFDKRSILPMNGDSALCNQ
jgi:RNase P/RNase MRP subunit POP5